MKFKRLFLLWPLLIAANSQAAFPTPAEKTRRSAQLTHFQIGQDWLGAINGGSVDIDPENGTLRLTLFQAPSCDDMEFCVQAFVEYHEIEVALYEVAELDCQIIRYRGQRDQTPSDGLLEHVEVLDKSQATCRLAVPHDTELTYETFNPWTQDTQSSHMQGETLIPAPELMN